MKFKIKGFNYDWVRGCNKQELKPTKNIQEQKRKSKKVTKKQENKINT